jgi:hypothetical protein
VVRQVVCHVVQRTVHHAVEVENQEARVGLGGSARSADLAAMPSARAAACAASPRTGVRRHARVTESIFYGWLPSGFHRGVRDACAHGPAGAPAAVGACALLIKCVILVLGISGLRGFGASQYL